MSNNQFYSEINTRVKKKKKNCLIMVIGDFGSGKSWLSCKAGHDLDKNFNVEERVIFRPREFINLLKEDKLKFGSTIVFDEVGVGMGAREWHSFYNRALDKIIQTFRNKRLVVFFTVPVDSMLVDSHLRKFFHYEVECTGIDFDKKETVCKIYRLQYNHRMKKIYRRRIRGNMGKYGRYRFPILDKPLSDVYERKSKGVKQSLIEELDQEIENREKEKKYPYKETDCKCLRCGHEWRKTVANPARCPKCSSRKWDGAYASTTISN